MRMWLTGVLIVSVTILVGCATVYLETETPRGTVPPAPAPATAQGQPRPTPRAPSATAPSLPLDGPGLQRYAQPPPVPPLGGPNAGSIERFKKAYKAKGSPRIAVLLNRALSDEVREWRTPARAVITGTRQKTVGQAGKETRRVDEARGLAAYDQVHDESGARPSPGEQWMWAFEDGFLQPFLSAGAGGTAAKSGKQGDPHSLLSVKQVEMDALAGGADIFVELLVSRAPSSPYGYEFKACAKEVKTGVILANVTSLRWSRLPNYSEQEVVATSRGYEFRGPTVPPIDVTSSSLAIDLMSALTRAWSE